METCFCLRNLGGRKIGGGISTTSGSMKSEFVFPEINRFLFGDRESEGKCEKNVSTRIKIVSVSEREREREFSKVSKKGREGERDLIGERYLRDGGGGSFYRLGSAPERESK